MFIGPLFIREGVPEGKNQSCRWPCAAGRSRAGTAGAKPGGGGGREEALTVEGRSGWNGRIGRLGAGGRRPGSGVGRLSLALADEVAGQWGVGLLVGKNFLKKHLPSALESGYMPLHAEVVELVDTLGSGSSGGSPVGVRLSPSAPNLSPTRTRKARYDW